jgi:MSHA biogenesis protein MshP
MRPERGFGLVAALFLIIVIAAAIAVMARLSITTNSSVSLGLQQARAYQAARAGIEWGIQQSLKGSCDAGRTQVLDGFSVTVQCARTSVSVPEEENDTPTFYRIVAAAQYGTLDSPDYAYRQLTAVVEGGAP